jgi:glutathione S-transferase
MTITVHGYRYSVYTRILKMALCIREVSYDMHEVDPFVDPPDPELNRLNPFGRVPVFDHDGFVLAETAVICRYVSHVFPGAPLVPEAPRSAARMEQVIAAIDAYGYWPMVRQVFSHGVFRKLLDEPADPDQIDAGLAAARPVLRFLDSVAEEGLVLNGTGFTLADIHLAPMLGYFTMAPQGAKALQQYPALAAWWVQAQQHSAYLQTDPGLATPASAE